MTSEASFLVSARIHWVDPRRCVAALDLKFFFPKLSKPSAEAGKNPTRYASVDALSKGATALKIPVLLMSRLSSKVSIAATGSTCSSLRKSMVCHCWRVTWAL